IIQSSVDLRARINSGQPYDDGEVRDTAAALGQVGAIAEQRNLVVAHTAKRMAPPGLTLPERATTVDVARGVAANYMRGPLPGAGAMVQVQTPGGINVTVNRQAAPAFLGFLTDLEQAGAPIKAVGGYNVRNIAGTNTPSQHAYGNAIDIEQSGRNVT